MAETKVSHVESLVDTKELGQPCPPRPWGRENLCDVSILTYHFNMRIDNRLVECTLRYRIERCTEGYVLGDLLHSVTLFPGEEVFLSVRSRHSIARFTEDKSYSASHLARSSDHLWMETFKTLATDFDETVSQTINTSSHSEFKQTNVGGSGGVNIFGFIKISGGASQAKGEFDANSSQEFTSEVNRHLVSTFHQTNQVVRDTFSISFTQINSHREATSELNDELKVSTRRFKNINECHTVTHYFFQIAKRQRVKIELIEKSCRAINEFANTAVRIKPLEMSLATNLQVVTNPQPTVGTPGVGVVTAQPALVATSAALTIDQKSLQEAGRISLAAFTEDGQARANAVAKAAKIVAALPDLETFEQTTLIPTEALFVESELGNCAVCEPFALAKQKLELDRLDLENQKLKREIELLEKFKDYRCCEGKEVKDQDEDDED